jgi:hypothetical protein
MEDAPMVNLFEDNIPLPIVLPPEKLPEELP